jgi:hypothetical protein
MPEASMRFRRENGPFFITIAKEANSFLSQLKKAKDSLVIDC